jgi:hypothetical protein
MHFGPLIHILKILPLQRSHLNLPSIVLLMGLSMSESVTELLLDEGVSQYFELGAVLSELAIVETLYLLDFMQELVDPIPHILLCGLSLYKNVN